MKTILYFLSRFEREMIFVIGAVGYLLVELLWRGHSHWTMMLAGGICFSIYYRLCTDSKHIPLFAKCALGACVITCVELMFGTVVNVFFKWNVWDYSTMPFHFYGQICLPFFLLWFMLCVPLTYLCDYIRSTMTPETQHA